MTYRARVKLRSPVPFSGFLARREKRENSDYYWQKRVPWEITGLQVAMFQMISVFGR